MCATVIELPTTIATDQNRSVWIPTWLAAHLDQAECGPELIHRLDALQSEAEQAGDHATASDCDAVLQNKRNDRQALARLRAAFPHLWQGNAARAYTVTWEALTPSGKVRKRGEVPCNNYWQAELVANSYARKWKHVRVAIAQGGDE